MKLLSRSSRRFTGRSFDYTYPQRGQSLRVTNRTTLVTKGTAPSPKTERERRTENE